MKKSRRLFLTGNLQSMFFENFIAEQARKIGINGYFRKLEDGRIEIFIEGDNIKVDEMSEVAKRGAQHSSIRNVEEKPSTFQGFKEFKIMKI